MILCSDLFTNILSWPSVCLNPCHLSNVLSELSHGSLCGTGGQQQWLAESSRLHKVIGGPSFANFGPLSTSFLRTAFCCKALWQSPPQSLLWVSGPFASTFPYSSSFSTLWDLSSQIPVALAGKPSVIPGSNSYLLLLEQITMNVMP